jgi:hypothetical protein
MSQQPSGELFNGGVYDALVVLSVGLVLKPLIEALDADGISGDD